MTTRHIENRLAGLEDELGKVIQDNASLQHELITAKGLLDKLVSSHQAVQEQLVTIQTGMTALREEVQETRELA